MSTTTDTRTTGMDTGEDIGAMDTIRRGVAVSPELTDGLGWTIALAFLAATGQVVVPIAVQQTLDRGINGSGGPDVSFTVVMALVAALAIIVASWASYLMTSRLFTTSERGLATLRVKAFRHVHDLPVLTQNTERRGALVSRVTSDVDQVSQFLVFGGLLLIVSVGQVVIATVVMLIYSWQLAVIVWLCFAPLFLSIRYFQRKLSEAYGVVRRQVGVMLSAISEPVVGAAVVKSYAIEDRTQERIDEAIDEYKSASTRAQQFTVVSFSLGGISAGLANAAVLVFGIQIGLHGGGFGQDLTAGKVLAFAFLVTLFVGPVQMGTQIFTDAQNALVSWRRVIGILETPADLVDPGEDGQVLPRGPIDVSLRDVGFAYPGGPPVLREIDLDIPAGTRVAVVGETGSGKSTIAKLLTRLMDPSSGSVQLDGIDVRDIAQASLRRSVVLVPQEGFLFDDTLASNVQYGRLDATADEIRASADELGLGDWLAGLP
ncbi:ABC transporter ATP-binding protein, partial [Nocardioides hankookensis]